MANRAPKCHCGQVRIERQAVCRQCWLSAPAAVRARCRASDLQTRRQGFRDLFEHALNRREATQQPNLL